MGAGGFHRTGVAPRSRPCHDRRMRHWLLLLIAAVVVAGIAYTVVWIFTGGEEGLAPSEPDGRAVPLPGTRPLEERDIIDTRFDTALRGYRMAQVDAALRRTAYDVGYKQELIDVLEAEVEALRAGRRSDADRLRAARLSALAGTDSAGGGRHAVDTDEEADSDADELATVAEYDLGQDPAALSGAGVGPGDADPANPDWNADTIYRVTDDSHGETATAEDRAEPEDAETRDADAHDLEARDADALASDTPDADIRDADAGAADAPEAAEAPAPARDDSAPDENPASDGTTAADHADPEPRAESDDHPDAGPTMDGRADEPDTATADGAAAADGRADEPDAPTAAVDGRAAEAEVATPGRQKGREAGSSARTSAKSSGRRTKSGR